MKSVNRCIGYQIEQYDFSQGSYFGEDLHQTEYINQTLYSSQQDNFPFQSKRKDLTVYEENYSLLRVEILVEPESLLSSDGKVLAKISSQNFMYQTLAHPVKNLILENLIFENTLVTSNLSNFFDPIVSVNFEISSESPRIFVSVPSEDIYVILSPKEEIGQRSIVGWIFGFFKHPYFLTILLTIYSLLAKMENLEISETRTRNCENFLASTSHVFIIILSDSWRSLWYFSILRWAYLGILTWRD